MIEIGEKDFFINGIPFDHKTSVFPSKYIGDLASVQAQPKEMLKWLYTNQSGQQRFHLKNRLFVLLHKADGEHWRLKAELQWIKLLIDTYLDDFSESKLIELSYGQGIIKTDIIFGVR